MVAPFWGLERALLGSLFGGAQGWGECEGEKILNKKNRDEESYSDII